MTHKISSTSALGPSQEQRILYSFKRLLGTHVTTEHGTYFQTNANSAQHSCSNENYQPPCASFIHLSGHLPSSLVPMFNLIRHEVIFPLRILNVLPVLSLAEYPMKPRFHLHFLSQPSGPESFEPVILFTLAPPNISKTSVEATRLLPKLLPKHITLAGEPH
ncbi:hypothetical protein TNCV_2825461 [Trichonephila clavipes]|nr:hypothetical protein TNCV_2825461 [Trichonephila clavipes]